MTIYYAIFYPDELGGYGVRFPDAPAVNTQGESLEDALFMAADALGAILSAGRKGREYNGPKGYEAIKAEAGPDELVFPVTPSASAMDEFRPKKRIQVMVPVELLEKIDTAKQEHGMDRSKFICNAVEECLAR